MTVAAPVTLSAHRTPPASGSKDGEYSDRCPKDGCLEVDRVHKNGGRTSRGEQYLNWAMYNADARKGGCGYSWTRTTKQGIEHDASKGVRSRWKTRSAERDTFHLTTSALYRTKYDCAFLKCGCDICAHVATLPASERAGFECGPCLYGEPILSEPENSDAAH